MIAREIHGMVNVVTDGFIWIELYVLSDMVDFCDDRGIYMKLIVTGYLWSTEGYMK